MQVVVFWYELPFSSRYVQLQPAFAMSYIFLEKRATRLELVPLLSTKKLQVATWFWYELHFLSTYVQLQPVSLWVTLFSGNVQLILNYLHFYQEISKVARGF
jgi:hypothetical protein